jgi:hypothetical protein
MAKAGISTGAASNFLTLARIVMAYRNTTNDELYPVHLPIKYADVDPNRYLDGREQEIICGDSVTINWSLGGTARMVFDRDTVALTLLNGVNGKEYRLLAKQSAGGLDIFTYVTTIKWLGKILPSLSVDGDAEDLFIFNYINGTWYGRVYNDFGVVPSS